MKETFFTIFETFSIDSSPNSLDWFPFFLFVFPNFLTVKTMLIVLAIIMKKT